MSVEKNNQDAHQGSRFTFGSNNWARYWQTAQFPSLEQMESRYHTHFNIVIQLARWLNDLEAEIREDTADLTLFQQELSSHQQNLPNLKESRQKRMNHLDKLLNEQVEVIDQINAHKKNKSSHETLDVLNRNLSKINNKITEYSKKLNTDIELEDRVHVFIDEMENRIVELDANLKESQQSVTETKNRMVAAFELAMNLAVEIQALRRVNENVEPTRSIKI